jgi:hypothetical protein
MESGTSTYACSFSMACLHYPYTPYDLLLLAKESDLECPHSFVPQCSEDKESGTNLILWDEKIIQEILCSLKSIHTRATSHAVSFNLTIYNLNVLLINNVHTKCVY